MENHTTNAEPSNSVSYVESTGDSEGDTIPDTAVSRLCITRTNTSTDDDDAESTSGEFVDAKDCQDEADQNRRRSPVEVSTKNIKEESTYAKLVDKKTKDEQEKAQKEVVQEQGDAESDRRFWDACIAHGY